MGNQEDFSVEHTQGSYRGYPELFSRETGAPEVHVEKESELETYNLGNSL